jgi:hypothetical protein
MGSFENENSETYHPIVIPDPRFHASETTKIQKKSELIGIRMGSFENFKTYHPIAIPIPNSMLARLRKYKKKGELIGIRMGSFENEIPKCTIRSRSRIPDSTLARLQKYKKR